MGLDAAKEIDFSACIIIIVKCVFAHQPPDIVAWDCAMCTQCFPKIVVVTVNSLGRTLNGCAQQSHSLGTCCHLFYC